MRIFLALATAAFLIGLSPASAMCGGEKGGGMCAAPAEKMSSKADAIKSGKQSMMGCSCCKNMASMEGMKADENKSMKMRK